MGHLTPVVRFLQQALPHGCAAKTLGPSQRLAIGLEALAGNGSVTGLAERFDVSRKFVYRQSATAQAALHKAFTAPAVPEEQVLFHLPVTKAWLRQVALSLTLSCRSSYRGVFEFCRDLLCVNMPVGTVHNILKDAVVKARSHNLGQNLAQVDIAGLDEIFQLRQAVLVGVDIASTYCFLLSREACRDADTWAIRLLELQERGLAPRAAIADFGSGLRAGLKLALEGTACRGDVFHALLEITPLVRHLEKRAYAAMAACHKLAQKKSKTCQQGGRSQALAPKLAAARRAENQAVALADDIALLARWLRLDVFAVSGLPYSDRCVLFDFILSELQARQPRCPERIASLCTLLLNHRDDLLAFAAELERDLTQVAERFQVPLAVVRELLDLDGQDPRKPRRWQNEAALRRQLRQRFYPLRQAVRQAAKRAVRASSIVENINSRLRPYFFLRRHLGHDYLDLLQFFLNHRCFLRSEHPGRVGKSPAELLTGATHPHWLEMLGYRRFSRN